MPTSRSTHHSRNNEDRDRFEAIIERFEDAWRHGPPPGIDEYLPQDHAERKAVLVELVHTDLKYRLKAGEAARVEEYLQRYPEMAANRAMVIGLVLREVHYRRPAPSVEELRLRFPDLELINRLGPWANSGSVPSTIAGLSANFPNGHMSTAALPEVPGYELLDRLGKGGMGVVYKARQLWPNRIVALKMMSAEHTEVEDLLRFLNEGAAIARLHHPNIIQIYDVGQQQAKPYFTMEFAERGSLAGELDGTPVSALEAARVVEILARAMQHAHDQGIIHRDLKPGNILLCSRNPAVAAQPETVNSGPETLAKTRVSGRRIESFIPKISDFGLAKRLGEASGLTTSHALLGTPSYMAPEQAGGTPKAIGPATDVYALGAVLYEMLTGRPPFRAESKFETILQVLSDEPLSPSRIQPKLAPDIETICLKCLKKEPRRRYPSAAELADDLHRFLKGEPIRARAAGIVERGIKLAKRHPGAAWALGQMVVLLMGLAVATVLLLAALRREHDAKDEAVQAQREAQNRAEDARHKAQALAAAVDFLTGLFQSTDPVGIESNGYRPRDRGPNSLTAPELLELGRKHLDDPLIQAQPVVRATLLDTLGNIYRSMGSFDRAERMLKEGLELRTKHLGSDHEDVATSLFHVGWLYHDQGYFDEAETLYRRALKIRKTGTDDLRTAAVMLNLAWVIAHQYDQPSPKRLDEAEGLFRDVIQIRRRCLGEKHEQVGLALAARAVCLLGQGKKNQALAVLGEALHILERPENKGMLEAGVSAYFASVFARQARQFERAKQLHLQALEKTRLFGGDNHPLTLLLLGDYAGLLRQKGDLKEAEDTIRKTIALGRTSALYWHPVAVDAILELADLVFARNHSDKEAEELYREAFKIAQRIKNPDRLEKARQSLDALLRSQNRNQEADALASR